MEIASNEDWGTSCEIVATQFCGPAVDIPSPVLIGEVVNECDGGEHELVDAEQENRNAAS